MKVSSRQLEALIQDLEDGCLTAADHERLLRVLSTDQEARRRYCEHMAFSSAMHTKAEAEADLDNWAPDGLMAPTDSGLFARSLLVAAAVLVLCAAVAGVVTLNRQALLPMDVQASAGSDWRMFGPEGEERLEFDRLLEGGVVEVRSGTVALTLESGTRLVLQGPARVKFPSLLSPVVEKGWFWVDTAEGGGQLTVKGGGLLFRDIGTRFAVRVQEGRSPELHVLEGMVEVLNPATGRKSVVEVDEHGFILLGGGRKEKVVRALDPFPGLAELLTRPKHYATTLLGQSPVGYWRMDARDDDQVLNSVPGGGMGQRGLVENGQGTQGVEWGVSAMGPEDGFRGFGLGNQGARFRGGENVTSAIVNLDSPAGVTTREGAVSFWFHRNRGVQRPEILWFAGAIDANGFGPEPEINVFIAETGRLQFFIEDGENDVLLSSSRISVDGLWHHVVASWSEEEVSLYIDGELAARDAVKRGTYFGPFRGFDVRAGKTGRHSSAETTDLTWFDGMMDEIALWDRALTGAEVERQFAAGVGE